MSFQLTTLAADLDGGSTQFERLNNMIYRAALKTAAFAKLNAAWQDEVVEERTWKIAIPPLWSALLREYWDRYAALYKAAPPALQAQLINPATGQPGGTAEAYAELTQPAREEAAALIARGEAAYNEAVGSMKERARAAARAVGAEMAAGAQERTEPAMEAWWVFGLGGLAALLWYNRSQLRRR